MLYGVLVHSAVSIAPEVHECYVAADEPLLLFAQTIYPDETPSDSRQ